MGHLLDVRTTDDVVVPCVSNLLPNPHDADYPHLDCLLSLDTLSAFFMSASPSATHASSSAFALATRWRTWLLSRSALSRTLALRVALPLVLAALPLEVHAEPSSLSPDVAYNRGEMETPRRAALGGSVIATGTSVEAAQGNPAGMSASRVYHLDGGAQIWAQGKRQTYGLAAVDSLVNSQGIAGGLTANWTFQDADGIDRKYFDLRFAMSAPLSDLFYLGATLHYLALSQDGYPGDGLPPSLASAGLADSNIVSDITFDAGLMVKLSDELRLGALGTGLTDAGHGMLPLTFGGGLGFVSDTVSLEADTTADFTTYSDTVMRVTAGAEVLLGGSFPLRGGYRYDEGTETQALSGGLGYSSTQFAVNATGRMTVAGPPSLTLVFGFRYHLESAGTGGSF